MSIAPLDLRQAFVSSAKTLIAAFQQLTSYAIVTRTCTAAIIRANTTDRGLPPDSRALAGLREVTPLELDDFGAIAAEGVIVVAYAWLESFLGEVEEALYLSDPEHLGENVQVKLG